MTSKDYKIITTVFRDTYPKEPKGNPAREAKVAQWIEMRQSFVRAAEEDNARFQRGQFESACMPNLTLS